jgi:hypothetical protein
MRILFGEFGEERRNERVALFFYIETQAVVCLDDVPYSFVQDRVASVRAAVAALDAVYEFGTAAGGFDF